MQLTLAEFLQKYQFTDEQQQYKYIMKDFERRSRGQLTTTVLFDNFDLTFGYLIVGFNLKLTV